MSDPVLAIILIVAFLAAVAAARWFKTLDGGLWRAARTSLVAGLIAGVLLRFLPVTEPVDVFVLGLVLMLGALYVRLTGDESEPADGMLLGSMMGAAAAAPIAFSGDGELRAVAACILAGAVAGFGITFAVSKVADPLRQFVIDAITALVAIGAAYLPTILHRSGVDARRVALGVVIGIPALVVLTVFKQWPDLRAELRHEASLGFIDDADVRRTAHPLLRLGRGGWHDAGAHREFVRLANQIALRKRQQRHRPDDTARLYQLEIIKLRMQIQEMSRIDHALRARAQRASEDEVPSDTMPHRG